MSKYSIGSFQHQHPYLAAMINNGSLHYDHDRDGTHTMVGGCEVKFRNFQHDTFLMIKYENDELSISTDLNDKRAWEKCFSVKGVTLPTGYFLGASAATGKKKQRNAYETAATALTEVL